MPACPICRTSMRSVSRDDVMLDVCDSCHGVWLDPHEFEMLPKLSASLTPEASPTNDWDFKCPGCSCRSNVLVDTQIGKLHRCTDCAGVYIPHRLLEMKAEAPDAVEDEFSWFKDVFGPIGHILSELASLK